MIRFRPFLNCDPPALAEIWRSQRLSRARMVSMTAGLFDELVLAKPFFDPRGLIVAVEDERPVGFAHAGFGPNPRGSELDRRQGAICQLILRQDHSSTGEIARGLIGASEDYLRHQGAATVVGGATGQMAPFYLGLYGGSQLPGVLASDDGQATAYQLAGFHSHEFCTVLECDLSKFRPVIDRQILQLRRRFHVAAGSELQPDNWWDACHRGFFESVRLNLTDMTTSATVGFARLWDMEPLASSQGRHAMGLVEARVESEDDLLLTHFLSELMRDLGSKGVSLVEIQLRSEDHVLAGVCYRLGFQTMDHGLIWQRPD